LQAYDIIVAGVMKPEVKQTIKYETTGELAEEKPLDEIVLRDKPSSSLTEDNLATYVRLDRIASNLTAYVKAYEKELAKGQRKPEKTIAVTTRSAYQTTKSTSDGVDWAYVTKSLVSVPTDSKTVGELNIISDASISRAEKEREMPTYKLTYREVRGTKRLYVSIQSVYQRIQDLKFEEKVEAKRVTVAPKEVV